MPPTIWENKEEVGFQDYTSLKWARDNPLPILVFITTDGQKFLQYAVHFLFFRHCFPKFLRTLHGTVVFKGILISNA